MTETAGDPAFEQALEIISDPDRLLPGEEPRSKHPDDARHWTSVYAELLQFKDQLVAAARRAGGGLRQSGRHELGQDMKLLVAERSRLRKRHRFWSRRLQDLGQGPD